MGVKLGFSYELSYLRRLGKTACRGASCAVLFTRIVRAIKRMVVHVERTRQKRTCFLLENLQQKGHLQDSGIDGRIKLIWMLWERMIRSGLDSEGSSRDHTLSFMNTIINIWVLQNSGKFSTMWSPGNFSSRSPFQSVDPPLRLSSVKESLFPVNIPTAGIRQ